MLGADIIFMIVQITTYGNYEMILRYWINIYLNIVLAYFIALLTSFYSRKFGKDKDEPHDHDGTRHPKKTLVSHFMNSVSLNVDIYAITFASFQQLDKQQHLESAHSD